ncbi:MAG: ABC transporter ATP-binding protein [Spirochaetaceae bacterium]
MSAETDTIIETTDIHTNFYTFEGVVRALNGVSVHVKRGETYALVGESGCGKSVTVRSMMRIVQAPGYIEDGDIVLFFDEGNRRKAVNILERSEAYMRSIRGNEISMIFQEASTSLNPVLTIGYQVRESFLFHRKAEMLEKSIAEIDEELGGRPFLLRAWWRRLQRALYRREAERLRRFQRSVAEIDRRIDELEGAEDPDTRKRRARLQARRERAWRQDFLVSLVSRVPFLKHYTGRLHRTIRGEVVALLESLGVPNPQNVVERYPHELSGGMQQRIVIAIALACHPRLLIADEPTSNLDVTIQAQILDLIRRLKETSIASVLFITHDLGVVAELCDRVTVMYAGDTAETAEVKELFRNPLHPYTQALLNSVPKEQQEESLATIPGTVPNLVHPPSGCRFHPRCPHAMEICRRQKPPVTEYAPGHTVSCHLYPTPASGTDGSTAEEHDNG